MNKPEVKKVNALEELKKQGYRVFIQHERMCKFGGYFSKQRFQETGLMEFMSQKGGRTSVEIIDNQGNYGLGQALCSKKDSFNRREGREIALRRALNDLRENRQSGKQKISLRPVNYTDGNIPGQFVFLCMMDVQQ